MRTFSITLGTLLASAAAIVAFEVVEPSMIVDLEVTEVQFQARFLREVVLHHKSSFGSLPTTLDQLVSSSFLARLPNDRWGNRYVYRLNESPDGFVVYSPGIDTVDQNGGGDDVITGEKEYDCDVYGTNCPLSPTAWGKLLSASILALSLAVLAILVVVRLYRWVFSRLQPNPSYMDSPKKQGN